MLSHYDENTRADVIRSMIVGGILGGLGGEVELAGGQNAQTREAAEAAGAAAAEQTESKNAVPMGTAEDLLLTPEDVPGQTKSADSGKETAESTIVNDDPVQHTTVEQQAIEEYKNASDQTLAAFIQRVRGLQNQNYKNGVRQTILTKTDNAIVKAAELTGTDTTGYKNIINGSSIQHIDNRHGEHGKADHSMADIQDFSRIGYVLDHFTDAKIIPISELDPETRKLTKAWNNSDDTLAPMVQFSMPVNGVYYVVEAVPSSKAKVMAVISAFISSGNESDSTLNQVLNLPESPTSSLTPEANLELLGAVSHNVPQPAQTVNTQPVDMTRLLPPPEVVRAAMEGRPLTLGQTSSEAQPFDMTRLLPPPEVVQAAMEGRPLTPGQTSSEAQPFDMTRLLPPPEVVQAAREGRPLTLRQTPDHAYFAGKHARLDETRGRSITHHEKAGNAIKDGLINGYKNGKVQLFLDNSSQIDIIDLKEALDNALNKLADPFFDISGSAIESHPEEVKQIMEEAKSFGIEVIEGSGRMAYSPGLKPGIPGQLIISKSDSFGAWVHERQHMLDDKADGWMGFAGLFDLDRRNRMEYNAYLAEINIAKAVGSEDVIKQLIQAYQDEVRKFGGEPIDFE